MSRIRRIIFWPFRQLNRLASWFVKTLRHFFSRLINGFKRRWLAIIIVTILCVGVGGYTQGWEWTGFPAYGGVPANPIGNTLEIASHREKTLWDWMGLILVPLTLFGIASQYNQQIRDREQRREAHEKNLEEMARQERYREDALQAYVNQMATLMLEHGLLADDLPADAPVWKLAQLRTVTVLRRMTDESGTDTTRINEILTFLRDSGLLEGSRGVLSGATLTRIVLRDVNLWRANLQTTNLWEAEMQGANLMEANLQGALLVHANLQAAYLEEADLKRATLHEVNLHRAILGKANLEGASLLDADLQGVVGISSAKLNRDTVLPDGNNWANTNLDYFTDPKHLNGFWRSPHPYSPAYQGDDA